MAPAVSPVPYASQAMKNLLLLLVTQCAVARDKKDGPFIARSYGNG